MRLYHKFKECFTRNSNPRKCLWSACGHNNKKGSCVYMHYNYDDIKNCRTTLRKGYGRIA